MTPRLDPKPAPKTRPVPTLVELSDWTPVPTENPYQVVATGTFVHLTLPEGGTVVGTLERYQGEYFVHSFSTPKRATVLGSPVVTGPVDLTPSGGLTAFYARSVRVVGS